MAISTPPHHRRYDGYVTFGTYPLEGEMAADLLSTAGAAHDPIDAAATVEVYAAE
ncbi:hypothetical protein M2280_006221, partial [Prescottella agglutinans]|nr:hypothetical protein [Prescottella agglutinans]